ncbi:ABC transporter permease [Ferrovibrio sp.]|uniref:ABC transporter permease n=1 Tax=Ferrovibrio sp. TaxID=1917215 RepID=UPI003D1089D5
MRALFKHPAFRNPSVLIGGGLLLVLLLLAIAAPLLASADPAAIAPRFRLRAPSEQFFMGTDGLGRDVFSRAMYGARVSLLVAACVAAIALSVGLVIGLLAGYLRWLDGIVMRAMDGLMAIPGILLAIALVSLSGASLITVIVAIMVPEIPRVARLVRSVVLSIREEPYVEAAIGLGTPLRKILVQHVLPNTIAPLIVQGTYICASAMLTEAILSFLGAGLSSEVPTWGNIISEGRAVFQRAPWIIFFPGGLLAVTVLAINILGDGLRDTLDPRLQKRLGGVR